jgi:hypothetical protein
MRYVNGCAEGVDKPHPFSRPTRVVDEEASTLESYPRATIRVRAGHEATIFCSTEDKELQGWLEAAKAHVMGLNTTKAM